MSFNFLNESYRKKHAAIERYNKKTETDLIKLFLDESKELSFALADLNINKDTKDAKKKSQLKSSVLEEIADCVITIYYLSEEQKEEVKKAIDFTMSKYREYKCDELMSYLMLKLDRTLRRIEEGYYD